MSTTFTKAMDLLGLNHEDRGLHLTNVVMEGGRITADYTKVIQIRDLPDPKPTPEHRLNTDPDAPAPGLYRVFWKTGGSSYAAVGHDRAGRLWLAPINWVLTDTSFTACFDWAGVERVVPIRTE